MDEEAARARARAISNVLIVLSVVELVVGVSLLFTEYVSAAALLVVGAALSYWAARRYIRPQQAPPLGRDRSP